MTRHLLHIGYPKAGSTFLQRWFDAHPQLAYSEGTIAGFRDVYAIDREGAQRREAPLYRVTSSEALSAPRPDSGRDLVDYTAARSLSVAGAQRQVCSMLADVFPNATVLIVTRGFRSMLLSSYSQYARSGGEVDLHEIVRAFVEKPDPRQLESWDYDRLIADYRQAFGEEQVIVLPYELLRDDQDAFLRTLAGRLGIKAMPAARDRLNEALSPVELYWYPRLTRVLRRVPSRRVRDAYIRAALRNDLRRPIAFLNRLRPGRPFTAASIPDELVEAFRGRAELLRGNPLYAPYAAEYLHVS
jgi:hypothetical protein